MNTQVYDFNTTFNFGKFRGKSLEEVIEMGEARYIGFLIFNRVKRFLIEPQTVKELDKLGFFDDMPISSYSSGGYISSNSFVDYSKEDILEYLSTQYNEFIKDPESYDLIVKQEQKDHNKHKKKETEKLEEEDFDPWSDYGKSYEKYGGYNGYSDDVIDDAFDGFPDATWNVD